MNVDKNGSRNDLYQTVFRYNLINITGGNPLKKDLYLSFYIKKWTLDLIYIDKLSTYIDLIYRIDSLLFKVLELDRGKTPLSTKRIDKFRFGSILSQDAVGEK